MRSIVGPVTLLVLVHGDIEPPVETVLDLPGLTAKCAAIENQDGQSFRRRVDRRRETGWSSADNGDVVNAIRIHRPHQPKGARQFVLAGITK